ncbi:MAG: Fic family protein [Cellvibrionaceae bacterium]|nr:Fic family protein [Cellvibrionaceae bacterium]
MADKKALLDYLNHQDPKWQSASEIKSALGDVANRSLRRWLVELVENDLLERRGQNKGTQYRRLTPPLPIPPASREDSHVGSFDEIFSRTSLQALEQVTAPIYTRSPVTYTEAWVESYRPNETYYLTAAQRETLHRQGKRMGIQGRAGTYIKKIFQRLLIDLSYNSARLEGNTYSIADTEQLLFQGISAEGKMDEERLMILNHKEAIEYLVRNIQTLIPDEECIRTLHYLLADSLVAPGAAGHVRDEGIGVSGTTYAPLEGKERLTRLLINMLDKARQIKDQFEQSFFLLGHISYLQAFVDVNKRTARLACIIPLIAEDYVPQSFIDVDKDAYLKAIICFYELNNIAPLAELYCWSYMRSCLHFDNQLQAVGFDEIAALYRSQRRALVAEVVRQQLSAGEIPHFLQAQFPKGIAAEHREKFLQDVLEEIKHLDVVRIAGMGITRREYEAWRAVAGDLSTLA